MSSDSCRTTVSNWGFRIRIDDTAGKSKAATHSAGAWPHRVSFHFNKLGSEFTHGVLGPLQVPDLAGDGVNLHDDRGSFAVYQNLGWSELKAARPKEFFHEGLLVEIGPAIGRLSYDGQSRGGIDLLYDANVGSTWRRQNLYLRGGNECGCQNGEEYFHSANLRPFRTGVKHRPIAARVFR